jgi:molybdopterin-guanine dinucleotide biosynthesis protein A
MTQPVTLYSAVMGSNPANSVDRRTTIRRETVGNSPVSADYDVGTRPASARRGPSSDDGEELVHGATSDEKRHHSTASPLDLVDRNVEPPPGDPVGNPGSDDAPAAACGTNATSESPTGDPGSATTGVDIDSSGGIISDITAIILTGGKSTRFGADKASTQVAGATMLDHILADIPPAVPVVVVGSPPEQASQPDASPISPTAAPEQESEPEPLTRSLMVTREHPPGGGPVAGVLAGLKLVTTPICCVIATDMPTSASIALDLATQHRRKLDPSSTPPTRVEAESSAGHAIAAGPSAAAQLHPPGGQPVLGPVDSVPESKAPEALIPLDANRHAQPLCASYSTAALRRAAVTLGSGHNASMRNMLTLIRVSEVQLKASDQPKLFDIDTRDDLARSRQAIMAHVGGGTSLPNTGGTNMLNDWAAAAASELDLDTDVDVDLILDVAKDAAHGVARPAAPLTTYLLGYAVAKGADLQEAAGKLNTLAQGWPENQD